MRKLRFGVSALLLATLLLGQSQTALAHSAALFTVRLKDATIPWIIPLESSCAGVPEGLSISPDDLGSDRLKIAVEKDRPDGGKHIVIADQVTGTASDNLGGAYTFLYRNVASHDFDGSIVSVHMLDFFELQGGDVHFVVTFNWRWAYPAASLELVEFKDDSGQTVDLFVDPFFFATGDGVNEDPNIVPGSWEQLSTQGDPVNCDPL